MKENEYMTITRESYNMMNDLLIERANRLVDLRKKIERLQEQLNEANEVIRYYDIKEPKYVEDGVVVAKDPAHRYLEKWGVK